MRIFVGKEFLIDDHDIVAILRPDSTPAKKLKLVASKAGLLAKATNCKKAGSLIILRNNRIVLSPFPPETLAERLEKDQIKGGLRRA